MDGWSFFAYLLVDTYFFLLCSLVSSLNLPAIQLYNAESIDENH